MKFTISAGVIKGMNSLMREKCQSPVLWSMQYLTLLAERGCKMITTVEAMLRQLKGLNQIQLLLPPPLPIKRPAMQGKSARDWILDGNF
jgi:hypothetical protein